jgi:hypothetical protein
LPDGSLFRDLIRRVRNRDQEAAAELVRRYESAIRRVVRIHLRDARMRRVLDSMDICQSVLASFFVRTALGQYEVDSPEHLLGLLTSITRNKLANQAKRLQPKGAIFAATPRLATRPTAFWIRLPTRASRRRPKRSWKKSATGSMRTNACWPSNALWAAAGRNWPTSWVGPPSPCEKKHSRALDRVMTELGLDEAF